MMIESDNKSHDDYHEPVKGGGSGEAISKPQQNKAYFFYHDIPHIGESGT